MITTIINNKISVMKKDKENSLDFFQVNNEIRAIIIMQITYNSLHFIPQSINLNY